MKIPRVAWLILIAVVFFGIGYGVKAASMPKIKGTSSN